MVSRIFINLEHLLARLFNWCFDIILTFSSAFVAGKFCDLVVAHGTRRWNCHKVVVCSQSSVLEAKLDASKVIPRSAL
jgi:hypothetical protein